MKSTKMNEYSKMAQEYIWQEAARVGASVGCVLENVDALFAGRRPIYRDPIFAGVRLPCRFNTFLINK